MKYLTLAADYGDLTIRDEQLGALTPGELRLPDNLSAELVAWNERYQQVIVADLDRRRAEPTASLIRELDRVGRHLAERISEAVEGGAKVRYYSEGLLRELP